ncbi:hypothetical protein CL652_00555 [bacterium]|nr:hypothetical protein [bacterium]|tara:strand:+ start:1437 stop:2468 length:1032 start_codon:yes stop_codon:yes gene_type:complete
MKKFEDTMKKIGEGVQLSTSEKEAIHERVREYMAHKPPSVQRQKQNLRVTLLSYRFSAVLVMLALIFTSGAGVTYASTNALPGDALYGVKEAAEEVTERLIIDEEKRAEYAVERAHRRLQEAEKLAARGKLDEKAEALVTERFEELNERAQARIATLEEEKPAQAQALRIALAVGVEARAETLALRAVRVDERENAARERIARVAQRNVISEESTLAAAPRIVAFATQELAADTAETGATVLGVAEESLPKVADMRTVPPAKIAALVGTLNKQKERLEKERDRSEEEERERVDGILSNITGLQEEITTAVSLGNYQVADEIIRKALRLTHKTFVSLEIDIEVP